MMNKDKNGKPQLVGVSLADQIKEKFSELAKKDGLKRTQRWLAGQINMGEVELSNKINNAAGAVFKQHELDEINRVLGTNFSVEQKE
jgi:hypothetical protein